MVSTDTEHVVQIKPFWCTVLEGLKQNNVDKERKKDAKPVVNHRLTAKEEHLI